MIKIILPAHGKPAEKVKSWKDIKSEALELREFIKNGKFQGNYERAYAISHAQVSNQPKRFFVLNEGKEYKLAKKFGSWCIVNLRIVKAKDLIEHKEGCMSWPFRQPKKITRFYEVKVKYQIPFLGFLIPKTKTFKDLPALVCQHETEHAEGKNLYGK